MCRIPAPPLYCSTYFWIQDILLSDQHIYIALTYRKICRINGQSLPHATLQSTFGQISRRIVQCIGCFCLIAKVYTILIRFTCAGICKVHANSKQPTIPFDYSLILFRLFLDAKINKLSLTLILCTFAAKFSLNR